MALSGSADAGERQATAMRTLAVSYLDVGLAVAVALIAIALGAPVVGCAVGAGGWILQRLVKIADASWARRLRDPRRQLGVSLFERFGRIWLLAGAIVLASLLGGRSSGLAAALIVFGAYTVGFVTNLLSGPPPPRERQS